MYEFKFNPNTIAWHLRVGQKQDDVIGKVIKRSIEASCTIIVYANNSEWTGSGFHVGGGLIATASHVCPPDLNPQNAQIMVTFDGKTPYRAEVAISDPNVDSALIYAPQIANNIPSVQLGNSDTMEVGDIIAAIGSPEGWHSTATVGRISNIHQGLGKNAPTPAWSKELIFIDADILEGSSGGMIIATDGLVYGSVLGVTGDKAEMGIGERAVCPSNKIITLLNKLKQN